MAPVTIQTGAYGFREVSTTAFWSARVLWETSGVVVQGDATGAITTQSYTFGGVDGFARVAQSFTALESGSPLFVYMPVAKLGAPTDNVTVEIRSDASGVPGTLLATSDVIGGASISTTISMLKFTFSTSTPLSSGTRYWLVLKRSGAIDGTNRYYAGGPNSSTLASEGRAWYTDSTSTWAASDGNDIPFRIVTAQGVGSKDLYAVVQDSTAGTPKVRVLKANSPVAPTSFTEQDSANNKATQSVFNPYTSWYDPATGLIHVIVGSAAGITYTHYRFDTATDLWTTGFGNVTTGGAGSRNVRCAVRSDGDVIVAFASSADTADLGYFVWQGANWSTGGLTALNSANSTEGATVLDIVMDSTDRAFIVFHQTGSINVMAKTLDSANTLSANATIHTGSGSDLTHQAGARYNPYDDAGTDTMIVAGLVTGPALSEKIVTMEAALSAGTISAATTIETTPADVGTHTTVSTAMVGSTPYAAWWDDASSGTVKYSTKSGGAWAAETNFATSITRLIEIVPVGTGLAVVYQSGTDVVMDFIVPAASNITISVVLATATGLQSTPTPKVLPQIPVQTASALEQPPTLIIRPDIPLPVATALLSIPDVKIPILADVPLMTVSALAQSPTPIGIPRPPLATASGLQLAPTLSAKPQVPVASASGLFHVPSLKANATAPLATATSLFHAPNFLIGPNIVVVPLMTVAAGSSGPTLRAIAHAPLATAAGASVTPTLVARAALPLATGSASFPIPAFLIGPNTFVVPLMAASGLSLTPTLRAAASAPLAAISGLMNNPTVLLRVVDTLATATGESFAPAFLIGPNTVVVPLMTVSALSFDPIVEVADVPIVLIVDLALANALLSIPTATIRANATLSTGSAATANPSLKTSVQAPISSSDADTFDPAFLIGPNLFAVPLMTGSSQQSNPTLRLIAQIPRALSDIDTIDPSLRLTIPLPLSVSTGESFAPATQEGATFIAVPISNGSSQGFVPLNVLTVSVPASSASGATQNPSPFVRVPAPVSTGSALLSVPSIKATVLPPSMTASGSASAPTLRLTIPAPLAAAAGLFHEPFVDVVTETPITVEVPLSSADAQFFPPSLADRIQVTLATASIAGAAPVPAIEIHSPLINVAADGKTPQLHSIVLIPQSSGSAAGIDPSSVAMIPAPMTQADGLLFDPSLELTVIADRMTALGSFLQPFIEAGEPWVMQFVAMARTLSVEAIERTLALDTETRPFVFVAEEQI
jgi:hypothetical protein